MWAQIKKYAPVAAIAGYALVYMNKGYDRILTDLQAITPEKLIARWQNFAVAAVALVAIGFVQKAKLPAAIKTILIVLLYLVAGHQIATAIDPPNGNGSRVSPTRNRYAGGGS
jgi:hypothetical protein